MSHRIASWFSIAALLLTFVTLSARAEAATASSVREIELQVGEQMSIPATGVAKYSEGVAGVIDVRLPDDAAEFIIVGLEPGVTTLLFIYDTGKKEQYVFTVEAPGDEVGKEENIRLDFYFVEISENGDHQVGVTWPSTVGVSSFEMGYDLVANEVTGATASLSAFPLPRIDALQRSGWAKVARQASVITANGKEASFEGGGEVNIAVQGSLAAEIRKIPFGTTVKVLPRYDADTGRLELKVAAEISSLTDSSTGVPGRSLSTVDTIVNVEMNQAVVLGGIRAESASHGREGLPLLSQIPVLGALFGRQTARQEHVQSVVFIVPSVVDVVGMDARRRIREALDTYDRYEGDAEDESLFPPRAGAK